MKIKFLQLFIATFFAFSCLMGQNIKYPSKDYQNWKKEKAQLDYNGNKASVVIQNSFVNAYIGGDGTFTIGTSNGERLLYGYPSYGSTSNTNIKVGNTVYSNRGISGTSNLDNYISNSTYLIGISAITEWTIEGIRIKQILTPIENPNQTGTIKVEFQVQNQTAQTKSVGILVQFDTMIDWNDAAPLKTSYGTVNVETAFYYPNLPTFWQAFEDPNYNTNYLIGEGTVIGSTAVPPSLIVAGSWPHLEGIAWNVTASGNGYGDSSVLYKWDEEDYNPGETKYFATFYGTGYASQSQNPLTIVYPNQTIELSIVNGQLTPNPFEVNLIAINNTGGFVSNISATINLPAGLSLPQGENHIQYFNPVNLQNGQDGDASFLVAADFPVMDVTLPFTIDINCAQLPTQTLELSVFIPALQEFEINSIALVIDNGNKLNSHKTKPYYDESNGQNIVFRRSLPFDFEIQYDGYFPNDFRNINFELRRYTEENNQITNDYYTIVDLEDKIKRGAVENSKISFSMNIPKDSWIGKYKLRCKKNTENIWKETSFFYIIFNPFEGSELPDRTQYYDDDVFSPNILLTQTASNAYVKSNDICYLTTNDGVNWSQNNISSKHYSEVVFNNVLKKYEGKYDAITVAKMVSVNTRKNVPDPEIDPVGILYGRWEWPYLCIVEPGIPLFCGAHAPSNWPDIKEIFKYYQKNKGSYFGQCYTFASLATSQLRSLGIPSRPICNSGDGVDNNSDNKVRHGDGGDKRWNFHEWTELWLPHKFEGNYFGWCAIDPTKEGSHRESSNYCGPAPVERIINNNHLSNDQWYDEDYFYSHISLPYYEFINNGWVKFLNNCSTGLKVFNPEFPNSLEDRTVNYLESTKEIINTDDSVSVHFSKKNYLVGDTLKGEISINSPDKVNQTYYIKLNVHSVEGFTGGASNVEYLINLDTSLIVNEIATIPFKIPYEKYQYFGDYQVDLVVVNITNDSKYLLSDICTVLGIGINLNYDNEILDQQLFNVGVELENQTEIIFEDLELRIITPDEFDLQSPDSIILIPSLNGNSTWVQQLNFLSNGNGKYPIIIEISSPNFGVITKKIEILIKGAPRLNFNFDKNNKGKIGEIFFTEFYITNDGYLQAENVDVTFNVPDLFANTGQINWYNLNIAPFDTLFYNLSLNPTNFGYGTISAEIMHDQTVELIGKNIQISSFYSDLIINYDTLKVNNLVPSYVNLHIFNQGTFNDKVKFLQLVSDTIIKCNLFHQGQLLPFNELLINSQEEKIVTLEIIPYEINMGMIAVSITSLFDLNFKQTDFIEVLSEPINEHLIPLSQGWSLISTYREPESPLLETIFAEQITNSTLQILLGKSGFFWPSQHINTIGNWNPYEGYKVKMNEDDEVLITGEIVDNKTINLLNGVNYLPVLDDQNVLATDIFNQIEDELLYAFDLKNGLVYWPGGGLYTLQTLEPGKAYLVSMSAAASVTFPETVKSGHLNSNKIQVVENSPWTVENTGVGHIISIYQSALADLKTGDIIAAFNSTGLCVGVTQFMGETENLPLVVYGNDLTTSAIDGMMENEAITFKVYNAATKEITEINPAWDLTMPNSAQFAENGLSAIISLKASTSIINPGLSNLRIFPNPNSGLFNIYGIDEVVEISVLNTTGQIIETLQADKAVEIDLSKYAKGIYYLKIVSGSSVKIEKVIIK